jgi:hypothetical protein
MDISQEILSEFVVFTKYAKYIPQLQRRETWSEICDRYESMMLQKYPNIVTDISDTMKFVRNKKVLPSMRAMQFAGPAITKNESRIYNCAFLPVDHYKAFSETMFLLLGGTGVGYSVQYRHVDKLPNLVKPTGTKKYIIGDSIEGWADAVKTLMKAYFGYRKTRPEFDFSDIREKGARLITAGGKAPGPEPLRICLEKIEHILTRALSEEQNKLTPIDCHDIQCHIANAVLAGGIRRAAMISLFSYNDEDMITCKSGNWWESNEQRGRANNSVILDRNNTTKEQFDSIWTKVKDSGAGEPGIYWTNNLDWGTNPCCFVGSTKILTPIGYVEISDLVGENDLINKDGEIVPGLVWSNGIKDVVELVLSSSNNIKCTEDHRFMITDGSEVEAKDLVGKRIMPYFQINEEVSEYTKYGFIQGDGGTGRLVSDSHKGLEIHVGKKDDDIFTLFGIKKEINKRTYYVSGYNEVLKLLKFDSRPLPERAMPNTLLSWSKNELAMFLKGMYSANGSIIKGHRISYKTTSRELAVQLQNRLSYLGISSYVTTNKEKEVEFSNGTYTCKQSYDINISKYKDVLKFGEVIGFVHRYKQDSLKELILSKAPKVLSVKKAGQEEVFDFSLDDNTHWGVVEGVIAHNCEIALKPFQFCNLTEVNVSDVDTQEELNTRVKVAAILGTFQAGFTNFHYLRDIWRKTTEEDALIGVGMTGIGSGKILNLNLKEAADVAKETNKNYSHNIGINSAARVTTIKPSGTTSCVLGTSSGIHAWHNSFYIRRIRLGKNEAVYTYLSIYHPDLIEDDYFRPDTQAVLSIPQKAPKGSILRTETALDLLERTKKFNLEWVKEGHVRGDNTNNVSATISIDSERIYGNLGERFSHKNEWEVVGEWMWENKDSYNGLSVLPADNGTYVQAPFEDITEDKYNELAKNLSNIDLTKVIELDDNTDLSGEAACSADGCIVK